MEIVHRNNINLWRWHEKCFIWSEGKQYFSNNLWLSAFRIFSEISTLVHVFIVLDEISAGEKNLVRYKWHTSKHLTRLGLHSLDQLHTASILVMLPRIFQAKVEVEWVANNFVIKMKFAGVQVVWLPLNESASEALAQFVGKAQTWQQIQLKSHYDRVTISINFQAFPSLELPANENAGQKNGAK